MQFESEKYAVSAIEDVLEEYETFLRKNPEANEKNYAEQTRIINKAQLYDVKFPELIKEYTFGAEVLNKETLEFIQKNRIWMAGMVGNIPPRILGVSDTKKVYDLIEKKEDKKLTSSLNTVLEGNAIHQFIQHDEAPNYDLSFLTTRRRIVNFEEEIHVLPEHPKTSMYYCAWIEKGTFYAGISRDQVLNLDTQEILNMHPKMNRGFWNELYTPAGSIEFTVPPHMHKHENIHRYYKVVQIQSDKND